MSIKQKIQGIIKEGLSKLEIDIELDKIIIENPKDNKHGDYSTNIALVLTKILKDNPMNIANRIALEIKDESIEKIEVAAPGFINIYLSKETLFKEINKIIELGKNYGTYKTVWTDKKYDANENGTKIINDIEGTFFSNISYIF